MRIPFAGNFYKTESFLDCLLGVMFSCNFSDSIRSCGGTITKNQTYLQNPGYPNTFTVRWYKIMLKV
jgi:hypothetical protein